MEEWVIDTCSADHYSSDSSCMTIDLGRVRVELEGVQPGLMNILSVSRLVERQFDHMVFSRTGADFYKMERLVLTCPMTGRVFTLSRTAGTGKHRQSLSFARERALKLLVMNEFSAVGGEWYLDSASCHNVSGDQRHATHPTPHEYADTPNGKCAIIAAGNAHCGAMGTVPVLVHDDTAAKSVISIPWLVRDRGWEVYVDRDVAVVHDNGTPRAFAVNFGGVYRLLLNGRHINMRN